MESTHGAMDLPTTAAVGQLSVRLGSMSSSSSEEACCLMMGPIGESGAMDQSPWGSSQSAVLVAKAAGSTVGGGCARLSRACAAMVLACSQVRWTGAVGGGSTARVMTTLGVGSLWSG